MSSDPAPYRFSVDEYQRMGEAGVFPPDARVELLDGEIFAMTPIGLPHAHAVAFINAWFVKQVGDRAVVWPQGNPLRLSDASEAVPDLTLLRPPLSVYRARHPRVDEVLLVVEVSDSTLRFDRLRKRRLYARAGIAEVWIVDIAGGSVEVALNPGAEGYGDVTTVGPGGTVAPRSFPDVQLAVSSLFA